MTSTPIHDAINAIEHPFDAFRHDNNHNQEQSMSRITDAKTAIENAAAKLGTVAGNPLADFIIDNGLGAKLQPEEVQLVASIIHALERAHQPASQNPAVTAQQPMPQPVQRPVQ